MDSMMKILLGLVAVMALGGAGTVGAQDVVRIATLKAPVFAEWDALGSEVVIEGDWAFVSALVMHVTPLPQTGGAVLVYKRTDAGWQPSQTIGAPDQSGPLYPSGAYVTTCFGSSMSVHGGTLAVGAWRYPRRVFDPLATSGGQEGRVFLYELSGGIWTAAGSLRSPRSITGEQFGRSVDLDDDYIVVGAPGLFHEVSFTPEYGGLYVFKRGPNGPVIDQYLQDRFGDVTYPAAGLGAGQLVIDGDRMAVGTLAWGHVHLFRRVGNVWVREQILSLPYQPNFMQGHAEFGAALALEGDRLVVGAPSRTS